MKNLALPFLVVLLAALSSGGCVTPQACTEMGCSSGVSLTIYDSDGQPAAEVRGTVIVDGVQYGFDCSGTTSELLCDGNILFLPIEEGEALNFFIVSGDASEVASGEIPLEFESWEPNGAGCDPVCLRADYAITLVRDVDG